MKKLYIIGGAITLVLIIFLTFNNQNNQNEENLLNIDSSLLNYQNCTGNNWQEIKLIDVHTGDSFSISDFRGKPILLESFALWRPTCLKQQQEIKKLPESEGDKIIHISLDTDPNEDKTKLSEYIAENKFNWYYAAVLIYEDQSNRLLQREVKSADELKPEIKRGGAV